MLKRGTYEDETISIEYSESDCKGDRVTPPSFSIDVEKVSVFCEAIDGWLDVTEIESQELDKRVMNLIDNNRSELNEQQPTKEKKWHY